jgi:type I restriction enzyme, S subunit
MTDKPKTLTPKLRFPEFRNRPGWDNEPLRSQAEFYKGRGVSKAEIDPNGNRPCIRYGELYTRYSEVIKEVYARTNAPDDSLFLSRKNDVIIPASGETKEDIATASCVMLDDVALGSDLNVIRTGHDGIFLSYFLNAVKRREIAKLAQGDTVVHLYPRQLEQISIAFPEPAEQRKVSAFLMSLDEWIAAEGRKLEALRVHKKGLMQQLFPRVGETRPQLRFPEFCNGREWEGRKIGDLLEKVSLPIEVQADKTYREIGVRSHGKGIFHKDEVKGSAIGAKRVFQVIEGALVLNIVFAWEQAVAYTTKTEAGMIASHRFPMFSPRSNACDVRFLKLAFLTPTGKDLLHLASPGGAGRNRTLGQDEFDKLEIVVPDKDEQTKVADVILAADALIAAQSRKLDRLRAHKTGLMQQVFPAPEEGE